MSYSDYQRGFRDGFSVGFGLGYIASKSVGYMDGYRQGVLDTRNALKHDPPFDFNRKPLYDPLSRNDILNNRLLEPVIKPIDPAPRFDTRDRYLDLNRDNNFRLDRFGMDNDLMPRRLFDKGY
jgi:hypothetical protein